MESVLLLFSSNVLDLKRRAMNRVMNYGSMSSRIKALCKEKSYGKNGRKSMKLSCPPVDITNTLNIFEYHVSALGLSVPRNTARKKKYRMLFLLNFIRIVVHLVSNKVKTIISVDTNNA